jgi:chromosome segregation ATPase
MRSKLSESVTVGSQENLPRSGLDSNLSKSTAKLETQKLEAIDKTIAMRQKLNGIELERANLLQTVVDLQNERDDALARAKELEEQAAKNEEVIAELKNNVHDLESLNYAQSNRINSIDEKFNNPKEDPKAKKLELKSKAAKSSPNWSPAFMRKNFIDAGSPLLGRKSQVDGRTTESIEKSASEYESYNTG